MKENKKFLAVLTAVAVCFVVAWFSTSGLSRTYEIRPEIILPEYKSDSSRAIDSYERMMNRFMDITEENLIWIGSDIKTVTTKLDSIENKLTELCVKMARIEGALGIAQAEKPVEKKPWCETQENANEPESKK